MEYWESCNKNINILLSFIIQNIMSILGNTASSYITPTIKP